MKPICFAAGIFLLIAPIFSFSQIPGYQGKRWVYTAGPGLNTLTLLIKSQRAQGVASALAQGSVRASYVTGRHTSTGASLTYVSAPGVASIYQYAAPGEASEFSTQSGDPYNILKSSIQHHFLLLSAEHRFVLSGKKGALAPCGMYMEGGAGAWMGWSSGVEATVRPYLKKTQFAPCLKGAIGAQKVYNDRIVVDFGVESTIPANILAARFLEFDGHPEETFSQYKNAVEQTATLWLTAIVCPYVRIGLLR